MTKHTKLALRQIQSAGTIIRRTACVIDIPRGYSEIKVGSDNELTSWDHNDLKYNVTVSPDWNSL